MKIFFTEKTNIFFKSIKNILEQAWPILISQWAGILFGFIDTTMTGHISPADLASMSLAVSINATVFVTLIGIMNSLIPILSQSFGAKKYSDIGKYWGQGIWLAILISALGSLVMTRIDLWLSISGEINETLKYKICDYLKVLVFALPPLIIFRAVYILSTSISKPKLVMIISLFSILIKFILNIIFIYGLLGFKSMGAIGAGLSTVIVSWMSLIMGIVIIKNDDYYNKFNLHIALPNYKIIIELLKIGIPIGAAYLTEILVFTFMALLIAREGDIITSGHQIMINLSSICYMMPMAIAAATSAVTGQSIGAKKYKYALINGYSGLLLTLIGSIFTAILLICFKNFIVNIYTNDSQIIKIAISLIPILPVFHIIDSLHCLASYLLRSYKIIIVPFIIQSICLGFIGVLGGWWFSFGPGLENFIHIKNIILPNAPLGAGCMWIMSLLSLTISSIILYFYYWIAVIKKT
ncbi:Multidrug resistance protein NorM [Candidatus Kinetoplastibacterium sorsogonicusi]|uniref:Multidrug-efflux transporter n=1 Tax=Candidatus Kinetoplastidibacterium kentomonadis TaxID=1576550 RepID=A0A3S7JA20_9PROT|nr:MATE family efflux transporter [Candidatus Kinetoplastibacterium sorsogonicusi]AWD32518.1 Multidrug resistance protein NorM [Candidatus Kinetoplastibacterium sorsogonicusi]